MPGIASSQARASATGISRKKPRSRLPARSCTARKTAWIRGAFNSGQVTPEISACTSSVGAAMSESQSSKRARSALKARPDSALRVRCDRSEEISSLTGSRSWK